MTTHGKTVAVPAIPKLFDYIHKRYAKLSLEDLINPAIELAIEGHAAIGLLKIFTPATRTVDKVS